MVIIKELTIDMLFEELNKLMHEKVNKNEE